MGASQTTAQLNAEIAANLASAQVPPITAAKLRQVLLDMAVSYPNVYSVDGFAGVDITGVSDSAAGLQAAINAIPDSSFLYFPPRCTLLIGSTITITNRVGLKLASFITQNDPTGSPQFTWTGANNGTMFDIQHCDHPAFLGLRFVTDGSHTINTYLNFDGESGGGHTGTLAEVGYCDFVGSGQTNRNYVAISISKNARNNHENYYIHDNNIAGDSGVNQLAVNRAKDGVVTSNSTAVTSATANFVAGDVGARIRLSYPSTQGGIFHDTTIQSVTNSTTIVLAAPLPAIIGYLSSPQTGVQITTGTNYGIGIFQGRSQNAKHSKFYYNRITGCDIAINVLGGSCDIRHLGGGFGGVGVMIGYDGIANVNTSSSLTDAIIIEQVEMEGNLRDLFLEGGVAPYTVTGQRVANVNQLADGFLKMGGAVTLIGSASVSSNPSTGLGSLDNPNAVVVGENNALVLTSIANQFQVSPALAGYFDAGGHPILLYGCNSFGDNIGNAANLTTILSGQTFQASNPLKLSFIGLPTDSAGLASGRLWSNSGLISLATVNLPTSSAGLAAGRLWNNGGVVSVA